MDTQSNPNLRLVRDNSNVIPFPQKNTASGVIWHCPKVGCLVHGTALRDGLAVRDIARHIVAAHLPDGSAA